MGAIRIDRCPRCGETLRERTHEQNDALHAVLTDISKQKQWAGEWLTVEDWKRLMVAAFERANKRPAKFFPALDGHGMDVVYSRTSRMSKRELSELLEFATAWAIENDIRLKEAA